MPSSGQEVGCGVTTSLVDEGWAATAFVIAGLTEAALGASRVFGAGVFGLAFSLVGVTVGFRASVTWEGLGFGAEGGGAALTTHPTRTTWLHPSPSSICSSEGSTCFAFGAGNLPVVVLFWPRSGARFARAALASFHFTQPR
jgi:hypothetical protein